MLPDFPALKAKLGKRLYLLFRAKAAASIPLLAQIQVVALREGNRCSYETEDAEIKDCSPKETKVEFEIPDPSNPAYDLQELVNNIEDAAVEMSRKQMKMMFTVVGEATESVGNVLDAKNQPISAEMILQMWETMQIDFDDEGKPILPKLVFHPKQEERVKEQYGRIDSEPELRKRRDEILSRQKEAWRDRESDRKLVD
jgi:hypothetical protein